MALLLDIAPFVLFNLLCLLGVVAYHAVCGEEIRRRDIEAMGRQVERDEKQRVGGSAATFPKGE